MKRILAIVLLGICCSLLTACGGGVDEVTTDYTPKNGQCVVSLPKDYGVAYENGTNPTADADLTNAETINGKPKNEKLQYFNLLHNEPFRIVTPTSVIQNKNKNQLTLKYWSLNGTRYEDGDGALSKTVFTCFEDAEIQPIYYEYKTVGMIMVVTDGNTIPEEAVLDENGNILERDTIKYLYGPYEFDPHIESWKTNLELSCFDVSYTAENKDETHTQGACTISVAMDLSKLVEKGKVVIQSLCKVNEHGYMLSPTAPTHIISGTDVAMTGTFSISLGEHTLQCTVSI